MASTPSPCGSDGTGGAPRGAFPEGHALNRFSNRRELTSVPGCNFAPTVGSRTEDRSPFPSNRAMASGPTRPDQCSLFVLTCQAHCRIAPATAFAPAAIMACPTGADVAEPVDAGDLKSSAPRGVRVRVPPSAPAHPSRKSPCTVSAARRRLHGTSGGPTGGPRLVPVGSMMSVSPSLPEPYLTRIGKSKQNFSVCPFPSRRPFSSRIRLTMTTA